MNDDDDIQDYVRPWVGLTDAEIYEIHKKVGGYVLDGWAYERLIEAKLKEKNGR
jgi:hypothetical protein